MGLVQDHVGYGIIRLMVSQVLIRVFNCEVAARLETLQAVLKVFEVHGRVHHLIPPFMLDPSRFKSINLCAIHWFAIAYLRFLHF